MMIIWKFSLTFVFPQLECLEHTRAHVISALITKLQATWRKVKQRRQFCQLRAAAVKLQANWRACVTRRKFNQIRSAIKQIQRAWKTHRTRQNMNKLFKSSQIIRKGKEFYELLTNFNVSVLWNLWSWLQIIYRWVGRYQSWEDDRWACLIFLPRFWGGEREGWRGRV